eukprot:31273-Pelagococcus_subviridis.AAC.8
MELDSRSNTRSLDARAKRPRWTVAGRAHTRPPALRPRLARLVRARAGRESPPALAREDSPRGLSRLALRRYPTRRRRRRRRRRSSFVADIDRST